MIVFLEKIWFLWWILATLIILRWFHLFSSKEDEAVLEAVHSAEEKLLRSRKGFPQQAVYVRKDKTPLLQS